MDKINIKGISFKIDNIYFVDIVPNETMKQILDQQNILMQSENVH